MCGLYGDWASHSGFKSLYGGSAFDIFKEAYPARHSDPFLDADWFRCFGPVKTHTPVPPMTDDSLFVVLHALTDHGFEALTADIQKAWDRRSVTLESGLSKVNAHLLLDAIQHIPLDKDNCTRHSFLQFSAGTSPELLMVWVTERYLHPSRPDASKG